MKKVLLPALAVALLSVSIAFAANQNQVYVEAKAYTAAKLPTTIDLNDNTEEEIRSYYAGLNSLSESERKGTNLLKNLKPILAKDQKYYSYDSGNAIWQMYEITDRDWEKSPASSTTYGTYDAGTNTITNYKYGTSNTDGKNNPYVHALYINRELDNQTKAWGNHNQDGWGINREHIWAKAHGFGTKTSGATGGARGDPMHLWAANGRANLIHSDDFFAFVDESRAYTDIGSDYDSICGNLSGYSLNAGGNHKVFEPQDSDKGDIARAIFYMAARYNYYSGTDTDPIDSNNPNLILSNDLSVNDGKPKNGNSTASISFGMGLLSDLLAWNKLDPVDEYEIHRNNLLYKNFTNNRNPFIDFPQWADDIWGTADLDGKNYNPTVSKAANPSTDSLNGEGKSSETFDVSTLALELAPEGTAKISGNHADADIAWSVDDPTVASLSKDTSANGEEITVTAHKVGMTVIRASAYSGGDLINKEIAVTVSEKAVVKVTSLTLSGAKKEFKVGDKFSTEGLVVEAHYNNGTSKTITEGYTVSTPDMAKEGKQTVTVTYEGVTATYEINIVKADGLPLPLPVLIGIGVGVVVIIVIGVVIYAKSSKKNKKKIRSAVKKGAKAYKKSSSKKK